MEGGGWEEVLKGGGGVRDRGGGQRQGGVRDRGEGEVEGEKKGKREREERRKGVERTRASK